MTFQQKASFIHVSRWFDQVCVVTEGCMVHKRTDTFDDHYHLFLGSAFSPSEAICAAIGGLSQEPRHVDSLNLPTGGTNAGI